MEEEAEEAAKDKPNNCRENLSGDRGFHCRGVQHIAPADRSGSTPYRGRGDEMGRGEGRREERVRGEEERQGEGRGGEETRRDRGRDEEADERSGEGEEEREGGVES